MSSFLNSEIFCLETSGKKQLTVLIYFDPAKFVILMSLFLLLLSVTAKETEFHTIARTVKWLAAICYVDIKKLFDFQ